MSLDYIRRHYGVPAKRGGRIRDYQGRTGTITGAADAHLTVRLDGERARTIYHPTWQIEYLNHEDDDPVNIDADRTANRPEQPDGIDGHSYDLPSPERAAKRIREFLTEYGDGLIEPKVLPEHEGTMPPLYARDLEALANEADR